MEKCFVGVCVCEWMSALEGEGEENIHARKDEIKFPFAFCPPERIEAKGAKGGGRENCDDAKSHPSELFTFEEEECQVDFNN